jgi:hypothetical protein
MGCDCIHAISDMDPMLERRSYPLIYYGTSGTRHLVEQVMKRPVFIDPPHTHDWLIPQLDLDGYPITREFYSGEIVAYSPEAIQAAAAQQSSRMPQSSAFSSLLRP